MSSEFEFTNDKAEYERFRRLLLKRKESNGCILCGSFFELPFEYVISNPTDIDKLYWTRIASTLEDSSETFRSHKMDSLVVDTKRCHSGFARLRHPDTLQKNERPLYYPKPSVPPNEKVRIKGPSWTRFVSADHDPYAFLRLLTEVDQPGVGIQNVTVDYVYSVYCPTWPTEAAEWITRERRNGWPTNDVIDEIVGFGCHLVPKPHQSNPDDETQWRFSFSQAEVILTQCWTDVQKYVYHILRLIKSKVVKLCGGEEKTVLCTYFFKTLMLWACEKKPVEFWTDENLETSVGELLCHMIDWLIERCCPNYFISDNNMIDYLSHDIDLTTEITSILRYKELYLSTLLRNVPNAYQNDPLFITVPHKLIVYGLLLYNNCYLMKDSRWKSLQTSLISSDNFAPELQYLFKGIQMHRRLRRESHFGYDEVTLAINCFELATKAQNEYASLEELPLQISVTDLLNRCIQFSQNLFCNRPKASSLKSECDGISHKAGQRKSNDLEIGRDLSHELLNDSSVSCVQRIRRFVSCYSRDVRLHSLRAAEADEEHALTSIPNPNRIISQLLASFARGVYSPAYLICAAYYANFYYAALKNYCSAAKQCERAFRYLQSLESIPFHSSIETVTKVFTVLLTNEWSVLFDVYLQIILGFLTLYTAAVGKSEGKQERKVVIHLCPNEFLKYIHFQSVRQLNGEQVAQFYCNIEDTVKELFHSQRDCEPSSRMLLLTAIRISGITPTVTRAGDTHYYVQWPV